MTSEGEAWGVHAFGEMRRAGYRSGGARTAVVEFLAEQDCCLTAQEIFDELRDGRRTVGIASVYRVLDLLSDMALVQRIDVGGSPTRYEPLYPSGEHHHHLVCDDCGKVLAFEDDSLEGAIEDLGERLGYSVDGHDVVLHGACGDCEEPRSRRRAAVGT